MHVPDGFLDLPTSVATGVVAAAGIGLALRRSNRELTDANAPLAGLVAAFVFAAQMINFPVGVGTSGHLMGGALAAVLVGPWTATLCVSMVLLVQALLFADGGVSAYGTNVVLMALVGTWVGWGVFRLIMALTRSVKAVPLAAAVGAAVAIPATAAVFVALFMVGGKVDFDLGALLAAMVGWHVLIGLGEAIITALVVGSVMASRPDLVYGARLVRARSAKQEVTA